MKKSLFCFLFVPFLIATAALAYVPKFDEKDRNLDGQITRNYQGFMAELTSHKVFQPSQAITNPLMDYVMFLTSYSGYGAVAHALDYLLKTGGPFGFSNKPANEQEKVFLAGAAQAVVLSQPGLTPATYKTSNPAHQAEIIRLQSLAASGNLEHPYHPTITMPERAQNPKATQSQRWQSFLTLIADQCVSERQFKATEVTAGAKADWLNDVLLSGYMMGVMPDVEGSRPAVRNYLDELWKNTNAWMETQHNYVQWWFPIHTVGLGDRIAPRPLKTTEQTLTEHGQVLTAIQEMLFVSLTRKLTFWGQSLNGFKITSLSAAEDKALGQPVKGTNWHENWIIKTHNYQRMSRFLTCLRFFKLQNYVDSLYAYLQEAAGSDLATKHNMSNSVGFWSKAAGK
ncbi:opioid growth factor receptor-related protein [Candidatus Finniella inopinata]|uniref:Opioid growth factor receptor (OGFr) conserved domain-containing protein n=1 Tax=Candidatus Finniella inopinata TaxID=1696036 RepID=A0A4Q7DI72_9PROT|nr:opioid growth factor receptor-related protein [Candidatus Finniella inopinata]RZI46483.1 hypothetical protein EQU50_02545 [Candidatus Finniella inopinata]